MRRRITDTVQYWAPGLISVIALIATLAFALARERDIGQLQGRVYALEREQAQAANNIEIVKAYVNSLEKCLLKAGIDLPPKKEK